MENIKKITSYYQKLLKSGKVDPDFFEFIRRLESAYGEENVGISQKSHLEMLRFGEKPHLNFSRNTISDIIDKDKLLIFVYFMGLNGVNGPLPLELTSYIYQRSHNFYDFTLRRFHDIIHHRFIGLFYRGWRLNEQGVDLDFEEGNLIEKSIKSLGGNNLKYYDLPKHIGTFWSGEFGHKIKNRAVLEKILNEYFQLPIRIDEHVISCNKIPEDCRSCLGQKKNCRLGYSLQLGAKFYSNSKKIAINVGPANYNEIQFMLPMAPNSGDLSALICSYLDKPYQYDTIFKIYSKTLPRSTLNGSLQLGRSIWIAGVKNSKITNLIH